MKSLTIKVAFSALAAALLASPALAQRTRQLPPQSQPYYGTNNPAVVGTYPNGAVRSGSEESRESGAEFNVVR